MGPASFCSVAELNDMVFQSSVTVPAAAAPRNQPDPIIRWQGEYAGRENARHHLLNAITDLMDLPQPNIPGHLINLCSRQHFRIGADEPGETSAGRIDGSRPAIRRGTGIFRRAQISENQVHIAAD